MLLQCTWLREGDVPILRRGDKTHTRTLTLYKIPLTTYTKWGRTLTGKEESVSRSVFSKQECTSHCHIIQDAHYSSHRKPESQFHHFQSVTWHRGPRQSAHWYMCQMINITEYNKSSSLHAKPKSQEHHSTSTPPPKKVLSSKLLLLYNLLGLTSVGWSSLRLSCRTAASVKLDSGSHVASSIGYPVHIVKYS